MIVIDLKRIVQVTVRSTSKQIVLCRNIAPCNIFILNNLSKVRLQLFGLIDFTNQCLQYIIEKGSITIDGISLTVASVTTDGFSVSTIPHTNAVTTLGERKAGDLVNLETDIIGKYVERLLQPMKAQPEWKAGTEKRSAETDSGADLGRGGITKEFLTRYGF